MTSSDDFNLDDLREERLKHPSETDKEKPTPSVDRKKAAWLTRNQWLAAGAGLLATLVLGLLFYGLYSRHSSDHEETMAAMEDLQILLQELDERLMEAQEQNRVDLEAVQQRVGITQNEIRRNRQLAERARQEQRQAAEDLTAKIVTKAETQRVDTLEENTNQRLVQIDDRIETVDADVKQSRSEWEVALTETREELSGLGLKLTEQGQLIATTQGGLEELRKRGERDYFQFEAARKQRITIAGIGLELRDTNRKRNHAHVRLFFDDRQTDRKRTFTNTPLTFYVGPDRVKYELVINQVDKGRVNGYVSVPSGALPERPALSRPGR